MVGIFIHTLQRTLEQSLLYGLVIWNTNNIASCTWYILLLDQ